MSIVGNIDRSDEYVQKMLQGLLLVEQDGDPFDGVSNIEAHIYVDETSHLLHFVDSQGNDYVINSGISLSNLNALLGTVQNLTGAGTANITTGITRMTTVTAADAVALAALPAGQSKTIIMGVQSTAGDTVVVTPAGLADGTTITLRNPLDSVTLIGTGAGSFIKSYAGNPLVA